MSRAGQPASNSWVNIFIEAHARPSYRHTEESNSITITFDDTTPFDKLYFMEPTEESLQRFIDVFQQAQEKIRSIKQ